MQNGLEKADFSRVIPKYYRDQKTPMLVKEQRRRSISFALKMNTKHFDDDNSTELPRWTDCDFFCIHDYAGTGALPCGWRGRFQEVHQGKGTEQLLCPRCGCATLLRIPLEPPVEEENQ